MKLNNIAFFGTPELAVWVLEELQQAGIVPDLVVTAPDKPVGRKKVVTAPPVKVWAEERDITTLQTPSLKDHAEIPELANSEWDLFIVAAYNIILPKWVLDLPKHGVLNVHPSLLPKLRGPSPIRTAIRDDLQEEVGVSIMLLDEEVDHGPLVAQATVELPEWPVCGGVLDGLLFHEGGRLLSEVVPLWLREDITPEAQDHSQATYTEKYTKADGEIDLADDPYVNFCKYCAMDGWPGVFIFVGEGENRKRIKIIEAEYHDGAFTPLRVVPEGKRGVTYEEFLRM